MSRPTSQISPTQNIWVAGSECERHPLRHHPEIEDTAQFNNRRRGRQAASTRAGRRTGRGATRRETPWRRRDRGRRPPSRACPLPSPAPCPSTRRTSPIWTRDWRCKPARLRLSFRVPAAQLTLLRPEQGSVVSAGKAARFTHRVCLHGTGRCQRAPNRTSQQRNRWVQSLIASAHVASIHPGNQGPCEKRNFAPSRPSAYHKCAPPLLVLDLTAPVFTASYCR